jgi:hypothetical protein
MEAAATTVKEPVVLLNDPTPTTMIAGTRPGQYFKDYGKDDNYKLIQWAVGRVNGEQEDDNSSDCEFLLLCSNLFVLSKSGWEKITL